MRRENLPSGNRINRRSLLQTGATTGALFGMGLGDLGFLRTLRPVSAEESQLDPGHVQLDSSIAPIVKLLEETPRDRLLEVVAERIRGGLSYRDLLAGLLLAGVKNVEPRPSVGHKFHAVLVVNSAHLASISSPPEHRWLPIFWALDYYKSSEAADVRERGDWTMSAADKSRLPRPSQAAETFTQAMDNWDEEAADAAVVRLARSAGLNKTYEHFFRYGARDFRSIGHKAIFVANSYRTLNCIGHQHAEPVLRSLAYALLMHEGSNPAQRDAEADRPYRRNQELVQQIRPEWLDGDLDSAATESLLETLRTGSNDEACDQVVELLNRGTSPQSIWDALFVGAGELLMRQPAIVALHAVTTTNALAFAYQASGDDETRRLMLLQNAAFLPMFRAGMLGRGNVKELTIRDLAQDQDAEGDIESIFAQLGEDSMSAARKTRNYLREHDATAAKDLIDAARVLIFLKGTNAHDYKFSSAILEDYYHVSPEWRADYLASNIFQLRSSQASDNRLVQRTREALTT
jgi:hypothetical protein